MINFPIVDIKIDEYYEQYAEIKALTHEHECLLLCPCSPDNASKGEEIHIGSLFCVNICLHRRYASNSLSIIHCAHVYWIKCLEREFYKIHGEKSF